MSHILVRPGEHMNGRILRRKRARFSRIGKRCGGNGRSGEHKVARSSENRDRLIDAVGHSRDRRAATAALDPAVERLRHHLGAGGRGDSFCVCKQRLIQQGAAEQAGCLLVPRISAFWLA